ncbi:calcium channel MID1 [Sporothrix brasiliensis 5110]|uniref:Calcium channel MID1 n=1 Tax=Sporothrix brasiliensis 5110 TaxID=1398154 RepID=A0A0C2FTC3_9PEZI|nr:calcium channel MID1 [Sporothrix brasiliensis 5110]KIH94283.1 calcium channel MID1 [Sporothrix brasiliensis 5110]
MASALTLFLPLLLLLSFPHNSAVAATTDTDADAGVLEAPSPLRPDGDDGGGGFIQGIFRSLLQNGGSTGEDAGSAAEGSSQTRLYEPDFGIFDRGILGRAPPGVSSLTNNVPVTLNVVPGTTQVFVFEKALIFGREAEEREKQRDVELRRREAGYEEGDGDDERDKGRLDLEDGGDDSEGLLRRQSNATSRTVYFSANTCIQPQLLSSTISGAAPQLTMYVSTTSSNISPGPASNPAHQTYYVFEEGAVMASLNVTDDVYIGISAPNISSTMLSGTYNFQLGASVDDYYHSYDNETDANLIWVDSDSSASLLITHNLTDSTAAATDANVMGAEPYVMFAQNVDDRSADGVRFSYCGLQTYAQIAATNNGKFTSMVTTGMTLRGLGNLPKQQFYFSGLNASSNYVGILAALPQNGTGQVGSNVVGGGGKVARATSFQTKAPNANCEVIFDLPFCNETAYAVPSNPTRFTNSSQLAAVYDQYASDMFAIFKNVLAQIPCEAPDTQRYSLARTCADCEAAYKNWLCSVAIPRCSDISDNSTWLQPRAISQPNPITGEFLAPDLAAQYPNTTAFNSSRNPFIDDTIAPGPYKEVMPCDDLCYNLVQSCPSNIGFSCPLPGYIGFNTSYGRRSEADQDGFVTCNYPGSAHYFSAAPAGPQLSWLAVMVVTFAVVMV